MNLNDLKILDYANTSCKRFNYWVKIKDYRKIDGQKARKSLIKFFESSIGPLGKTWNYHKLDYGIYLIKFNSEKDLLFFLLKAQRD